jgi:4-aminobutyrate aminotransferase
VQTGFGRTGRFWGHDHFDGRPDIVVTAKGLASGFPLSAIAAPTALMEKAWPGSQGGTYGGNAVACAAAIATLDVIQDEKLVENSAARGTQLLSGLRETAAGYAPDGTNGIGDVRGLGLMAGTEFVTGQGEPDGPTAARVQAAAGRRGLLLLTCGVQSQVVRMIPPLVVNEEQVREGLTLWADAVSEVLG